MFQLLWPGDPPRHEVQWPLLPSEGTMAPREPQHPQRFGFPGYILQRLGREVWRHCPEAWVTGSGGSQISQMRLQLWRAGLLEGGITELRDPASLYQDRPNSIISHPGPHIPPRTVAWGSAPMKGMRNPNPSRSPRCLGNGVAPAKRLGRGDEHETGIPSAPVS